MYCKNCGNPIEDEAKFCKFCGDKIIDSSKISSHNTIMKIDSTYNLAYVGILLILLSNIILFFLPWFELNLAIETFTASGASFLNLCKLLADNNKDVWYLYLFFILYTIPFLSGISLYKLLIKRNEYIKYIKMTFIVTIILLVLVFIINQTVIVNINKELGADLIQNVLKTTITFWILAIIQVLGIILLQKLFSSKEIIYNEAMVLKANGKCSTDYNLLIAMFESISGYKDADEQALECKHLKTEATYNYAMLLKNNSSTTIDYKVLIEMFESISGYKDADEQALECSRLKSEKLNNYVYKKC